MDIKPKVLFIDDESNNLVSFKANFRSEFDITLASNLKEAAQFLEAGVFHIIICDQNMPEGNGIEFLTAINKAYPKTFKAILTAYKDFNTVKNALNSGVIFRYIIKPWDNNEITQTVNLAYEIFMLREEREKLLEELVQAKEDIQRILKESNTRKTKLMN